MKRRVRISEAEWEVMQIIWSLPGCTAQEVIGALKGKTNWSAATVKTLLNRLMKKGALSFRKDGRLYHYWPEISEADCRQAEADNFLQRFFGGALTPMLVHFVKAQKLSKTEYDELFRLLKNESKKE